jgi:EAL domain-containing protein (putative c-di-GMP-specific phosphodiesterase class I)
VVPRGGAWCRLNPHDRATVRHVIELAHDLGLTVVTEGVDT